MPTAALLPPLLPTPPRSEMLPILPTPPRSKMLPLLPTPCGGATIQTASLSKPGRADSVERWDAHKKPCSSSSSTESSASVSPCRADSVERWDSKKISTTRGMSTDRGCQNGSYKRPPSRASSAERWDLHKKPRPETDDMTAKDTTTMARKEMPMKTAAVHKGMPILQQDVFAGSNMFASPEPCMLPMPTFFLMARAH